MNLANKDSVIDSILEVTGLDQVKKTKPVIINKILKDLKLHDFQTSFQPLQEVLTDAKKTPQDLSRFIDMIRKGLRQNDTIIEFLIDRRKIKPAQSCLSAELLHEPHKVSNGDELGFYRVDY